MSSVRTRVRYLIKKLRGHCDGSLFGDNAMSKITSLHFRTSTVDEFADKALFRN